MWGTGYSTVVNDRKKNGLYEHLVTRVTFSGNNNDLIEINNRMTAEGSTVPTVDVFNYWIASGDNLKIDGTKSLAYVLRKEARHVFVYHLCIILYTIATTLKKEKYDSPRELLICGGGSRYLDNFIDSDVDKLGRLAKVVFDHVWQADNQAPKIHLEENRKEATGYGALYMESDQMPKEYFLNELPANEVMGLLDDITKQIQELNVVYIKMMQVFDDGMDIDDLSSALNADLGDAVYKTLHEQVHERANKSKNYKGALLTIPALDRLITLTHTLIKN